MKTRSKQNALRLLALLAACALWVLAAGQSRAHTPPRLITAATQQGEVTWIGSTEGLWRLADGQLTPFELPFLDAHVTALYSEGSELWVGTYSAIGRYSADEGWQTWQRGATGLPSAWARAFTTFQGAIVVGTYDRGVYRFDGQAWQPVGSAPPFITALAADGDNLYARDANGNAFRFDGSAWAATELASALTPARFTPLLPVATKQKPPVILIHGVGDSNIVGQSNMRFLARWLKADGYPVYYAAHDANQSLLDNAVRVAAIAAKARAGYPDQRPVIIAHSFGGLLARTYAALNPDAVAGMITLGTPHAGVRLAYDFIVPDLNASTRPQWRELLPEYAALVAPFTMNEGVAQLHIGGDLLPRENFFEGFAPHDGIVDSASAVAAPGATRIYPLLHGWTVATMRYGLDSYLFPKTLYQSTLRPFLAALDSAPPTNRALTPLLSEPGVTHTPIFDGALAPGERRTFTVTIDAPPATWFLDGAGVEMTLVAPDGKRYEGERTGIGAVVSHLPYRENVLQPLDLWSTEAAGTWQIEVENRERARAVIRLTVVQPQKTFLNATVLTPWAAPGAIVEVMVQAAAGQRIEGVVGEAQRFFEERAPGEYHAAFPAPDAPGYYPLRVNNGSGERYTVLTVRSNRFSAGMPEAALERGQFSLSLPVQGRGSVALGVRIMAGEDTIAAQLYRQQINGSDVVNVTLPVSASPETVRVEWQLFDAESALIPVTLLNP